MSQASRRPVGLGIALLGFGMVIAGLFWFPEFMDATVARFIGTFVGLFLVGTGTLVFSNKPWTRGPLTRSMFTAMILTGPALIAAGSVALVIAEPLSTRLLGALGIVYGTGVVVVALVRRHLARRGPRSTVGTNSALNAERNSNP